MDVDVKESYIIARFKMSNNKISTFNAISTVTSDCVPNALYTLGAIDVVTTDIIKILIDGKGISGLECEKIFKYLFGSEFRFQTINKTVFYNYCDNELEPNNAIFCAIPGHVFLIAKRSDLTLVVLDGQNPGGIMCEIKGEDSLCWKDYKHNDYYVLTSKL